MDQVSQLGQLEGGQARRLRAAMRLQEIEGNPFDAEDVALFEMFAREGWSFQQRCDYIVRQVPGRHAAG